MESFFCLPLLHLVANRKRKTGSHNDAPTQIWRNIPEIFLLIQLFLIDKRRIKTRRNSPTCTRGITESKKKNSASTPKGSRPREEASPPSGKDGSKHGEAVSRLALTARGAVTEVRGRDVLNNTETHSRNRFILRLKFVATIKRGGKGQITHLLLKVTTTTHRRKSTFCPVKNHSCVLLAAI